MKKFLIITILSASIINADGLFVKKGSIFEQTTSDLQFVQKYKDEWEDFLLFAKDSFKTLGRDWVFESFKKAMEAK